MTGDVWTYVLDPEAQNSEWSDMALILQPRFSVVGSLEDMRYNFHVFFTTFIFLSQMLDCYNIFRNGSQWQIED